MSRAGTDPVQEKPYNLFYHSCSPLPKHLNSGTTVSLHPTPSTYPNASSQAIPSPLAKYTITYTPPSQLASSFSRSSLINRAQQFGLQDVLPLLVLLRRLVRLVVLPAHRLLALTAADIPHHVAAGRHVALYGIGLRDVDDGGEEVGFTVLAAEVLGERVSWGCEDLGEGRLRLHDRQRQIVMRGCRSEGTNASGGGGGQESCP